MIPVLLILKVRRSQLLYTVYRIAGNIGEAKSWWKRKIWHIGGFKFGTFTIIIQPHPFACVKMEGKADVAKFVFESVVRGYRVPDDLGSCIW